jgi:hypothetical protein
MVPIVSHKSLTCTDTPIYKMCPDISFITLIPPLIITYYYAEGGYIIDHDENS